MRRSVADVVAIVSSLPPERVEEVYDFALFLRTRLHAPIDETDDWSEEDVRDVTAASLRYVESVEAAEALPGGNTCDDTRHDVRQKVERGLAAIDEGQLVSQHEAERRVAEWAKLCGQNPARRP
jgi:predicted transcriptional regulator